MTLKHEHIIELIEWFESKNHYFLVFELAAGGELFDHLVESPNCRSVPRFPFHKTKASLRDCRCAPPDEPLIVD